MDRPSTIAKLNIEHFRRLLASETDGDKRATLSRLLSEEEVKLRELEKREGKNPEVSARASASARYRP